MDTATRVLVLGGGSAGFMAALSLKKRLPDLSVRVIRSRDIGIIGVGEGSTIALTRFLHDYLAVGQKKFHETAQPTWKLGLKFLWGPRPYFHYTFGDQLNFKLHALPRENGFYCDREMEYEDLHSALMTHDRIFPRAPGGGPALHDRVAYHFENEKFVRFLEDYARAVGVAILDDTVRDVEQDERGVSALALASGRTEAADLYVDCSGFGSLLLGKALGERFVSFRSSLFCERAVVGGWDRTDEPIKPYTTCETMESGWCWQIEHENRINRGYVYSPAFVSDEEAEKEFRAKSAKVGPTRVVRFVSGRYERAWVKNVVAIGNAGGFVEPLEATALGIICNRSQRLAEMLLYGEGEITPTQVALYNRENAENWDSVRDFLAVHYRFNTRLDTPFWRECREKVELAGAAPVVEYFRENGPNTFWAPGLFGPFEAFGMAGYLAMLVGQQVPHRRVREAPDQERRVWEQYRQKNRETALKAMTVKDALAAIRSPKWNWV